MDNIFDIYSAKVDNNKVTEWDSNLLFPDWYASTNPLDYRLYSSAESWLFHTITDYYFLKVFVRIFTVLNAPLWK